MLACASVTRRPAVRDRAGDCARPQMLDKCPVSWPQTGLQSWAAGRAGQKLCRSRSPPRGGDGQSAVAPVSVGCEADRMRKGRVRSFCHWVGRKAATRGLTERRQPQHWTIRDGASTPAQQVDPSEGRCRSVLVLHCAGTWGCLLQVCCRLTVHLVSRVCIPVCRQLEQ